MNGDFPFAPRDAKRTGLGAHPSGAAGGWHLLSLFIAFTVAAAPVHGQSGWQSRDIGTTTAGSTAESNGVLTLSGSGRDVWNETDGFRFYFREVNSDFDLIVRVRSLAYTHGWAKAGVMARSGLEPGARHATMFVSAAHGTAFQSRTTLNGETSSSAPSEDGSAPRWLRLTRRSGYMTGHLYGYASWDGVDWVSAGSMFIGSENPLYIGLAVTSHNDGVLCPAEFDQLRLTLPPIAPTNVRVTYRGPGGRIDLAWNDNSSDESGFVVEAKSSDRDASFFGRAWVGANVTQASVTGLSEGETYYFRVAAVNNGVAANSSEIGTITTITPILNIVSVTSTSVRLVWEEPLVNRSGPGTGPYSLERSTDNANFVVLASGLYANDSYRTYYTDNTVSPGTYYYRVRYLDSYGNNSGYGTRTVLVEPPLPAPGSLNATAVSGSRIDLTWTDNSADESGFAIDRSTGGGFAWLANVGANVGSYVDTSVSQSTSYSYRVYARRSTGWQSDYSNVASTTTPSTVPPPSWQAQDIGAVATPGSSSESGGRVTVTASGADIWNTADEFHYRHQAWTGDGEIVARVTGLTNTNGWAKAGVMFRESLAAGARHAFMCVSIAHGTSLQYRTTIGGESGSTPPSESGGVQQWVRLVRTGSTFTGYSSLDGVTWVLAGSVTVSLPTSVYVGLAVTSHNDGVSCTSTFENVLLSGGGPPPVTPPNPPANLAAAAVSSSQVNLTWTDNSGNESGFEVESTTNSGAFTRLTTTTANATSFSHVGLSASTTYQYRVRAVNAAGPSAYTAAVSATTPAAPPPSPSWTSQDIGAVAIAGRTDESGGTIQLTGSGADIWNTADEFRYHHRAFTGDGEIVARVTTLSDTNGWAKAGLMFRESLDANARHATMIVSVAHGTAFQYRAATGGESSSSPPSEAGGVPVWLRLVRNGNTFTGHVSADGSTWTPAGSTTLAFPPTVYIGLAVTSHNDGVACTATFTNLILTGGGTTPVTALSAPDGLTATVVSSSQINLAWADRSTNETEFQIQRSQDNATWTAVATRAAGTTSYADSGLSAGTTYYYRVRAMADTTSSAWSNTASAATAGSAPPPTWSFGDIGSVGIAGSNESAGTTITIRGSGADIWDAADGFRFVYRTMTGDCVVEAQIASLTDTHAWAKAGVMIRESTAANARNVFAFVTPANGIHAQHRATAGGTTSTALGRGWVSPPQWVRLFRTGARITAFWSGDGRTWTQFAAYDTTIGGTVLIGFAVTSHNNAMLATAVFNDPFVGSLVTAAGN